MVTWKKKGRLTPKGVNQRSRVLARENEGWGGMSGDGGRGGLLRYNRGGRRGVKISFWDGKGEKRLCQEEVARHVCLGSRLKTTKKRSSHKKKNQHSGEQETAPP